MIIFFWNAFFSQCEIIGKKQMVIGISEVLSLPENIAQCKDCYQWSVTGNQILIEGDNRQNSINLAPKTEGKTTIEVNYLSTSKGEVKCLQEITVVSSGSEVEKTSNCDIVIKNFKEVRYSEDIVSIFPVPVSSGTFSYTWTAIYENGNTKISSEKVPQFEDGENKRIKNIILKVDSKECQKELSKDYPTNFWKSLQ